MAEFAAEHSDIMIAFASIDPMRGAAAVEEAKRLVASGGIRGLKLHPPLQQFFPNDRAAYPLYEVFADAGLPVLFHTGHSGIGTGMPRRRRHSPEVWQSRCTSTTSRSIFPRCRSSWRIRRSPGRTKRSRSACTSRPVYIDLSGWSPKYFSPILIQYANTLLKHKMLFGSDYPLLTPDRWMADFAKIDIRTEVRPLILKENAVQFFGGLA